MAKQNILIRSKKKKARALLEMGQFDEAASLYTKLRHSAPGDIDILLGMGIAEGKRGNHMAAAGYLRKAAKIEPQHAQVQYNLGVALRDAGRFREAIAAFENATRLNPLLSEAFDCLAHACIAVGEFERAIDTFQRCLAIEPGKAEVYCNLGSLFQAKGLLSDAETHYRKAILLKPDITIAENLGSALCAQGRFEEAIAVYRKGLMRQPRNARLRSNLLLTLNYLPQSDQGAIFEEHRKYNEIFAGVRRTSKFSNIRDPRRRLKIGYISPDFREHSVASFIEPVLEGHNRNAVIVYGYSSVPRPDKVTRRLELFSDNWVSVAGMSPDQLAEKIRQDEIDILVDLAGHTAGNSLAVFARQPAPIQVTWLGYPNTTGLETIRYRIVDAIVDPADQDSYYTEKLIRLPGCYLSYKPPTDAPTVSPLPATELGRLTFGSFNNLSKINDSVIRLWADVIKAVPGSRLLLKNSSLTDEKTRLHFQRKFLEYGLGGECIELMGHTLTREEHLALYRLVDIGLDTFPYNGTTTTCEALWMGVPVLTVSGRHHAGRVGHALLKAAGLSYWVSSSREEFIAKAVNISADLCMLSQLRSSLRERMRTSELCDAARFVRDLECAYRHMWQEWLC